MHVEGTSFSNKWFIYALVFFVGGIVYFFKDIRIGLILILIAGVLFFTALIHDYKKVSKGELYWEREPELFKGKFINCPHCSEKISAKKKLPQV